LVAARKKALAEGGTEGLRQFDEAVAVLSGSVKQALPGRVAASAVPAKKPAPKAIVAKAAPVAPPPPPVVVETPAAPSAAKVLKAVPTDAPRIDILFIQWGDERSERLASLRSQGGSLSVVYEGDVIDGMAVASIRADAIDFTWRGQTFRQPVHRY
jgi:type IV secretory pathway VirB10-like protein